ncbi:cytochrome P450 [Daedalea quercina L-15889]|uniref:Cytochrome P450 n=1 Tax=Daedalea quercina L-15889 TaxID=1314783 RepID=A0A165TD86_9APHY|nr:cytochrome P450 [Daedalea quercina L-15889]
MSVSVVYSLLAAACAIWFIRWKTDPLKHIPTIGPSLPILSYIGALRFIFNARDTLQEGYDKYKVFKVAMVDRWLVVVSGAQMNEELRRFPDEQMSFDIAVAELLHVDWTIQPDITHIPIHIAMIKEKLTRNLAPITPAVVDEVQLAFEELIPATETGVYLLLTLPDWMPTNAFSTMMNIIARGTNRIFVGAPLCRHKEFLDISVDFAKDVTKGLSILALLPKALQPIIGPLLPWPRWARQRILPIVKPMLDERREQLDRYGEDWVNKPNDFLMWCMDDARQRGLGHPEDLFVQIILAINFTALHTSTVSFVHALYHLAANPEYIQPLREEADLIIREEGWSKAALGRMIKIDSFLKESQRINGVSGISVFRRAMEDITFSNGTYIPEGTVVAAITTSTHHDEGNYENADVFDPFRFSRLREQEGEITKHHYVSTSPANIGFGHGKHACPGRFFAANELKIILANLVMKYDVKFANEGKRPENEWMAVNIAPSQAAQVLFKRRAAS